MAEELNEGIAENLIARAWQWESEHRRHVRSLIKSSGFGYPPSRVDAGRPELWKAEHWSWLAVNTERPEPPK